jgi:hypothetical protein
MFKSIASKQAQSSSSLPTTAIPVKPTKPIVTFADQLAAVIKSTERKPEDTKRKDLPLDIGKHRKTYDETIIPIKDRIAKRFTKGLSDDEAQAVIKDYYENDLKSKSMTFSRRLLKTDELMGNYTDKKLQEFLEKYRADKKKDDKQIKEESKATAVTAEVADECSDSDSDTADDFSDSVSSTESKKSAFVPVKGDSKRTKLADLSETDKAERHREQMKAWRQAHPDYNKTYRQRYYEENRDKILQKRREKRAEEKKQLEDYKKHMLSMQSQSSMTDDDDMVEYTK